MKVVKLHDKVYYYTDLLSEVEKKRVSEIINSFDDWERIFDDGNEYDPNRDNDKQDFQSIMVMYRKQIDHNQYPELRDIIDKAYSAAQRHYGEEFGVSTENKINPFLLDKHLEGTAYATHIDSAPVGVESFTALMYFNDDYTGGEIAFSIPRPDYKFKVKNGIVQNGPRSNRSPDDPINRDLVDFWIKPEAFSILIFPPLFPYIHTVHTITSGFKYITKGHWQVDNIHVTQWTSNPYDGFTDDEIHSKSNMRLRHGNIYDSMSDGHSIVPADLVEFEI